MASNKSSSNKQSWKNPALYKTRICDFWADGRVCKFGNRCWYSHGPHELRNVPHLENNFTAKTVALAEVLNTLPPSKDRNKALDHADGLVKDANNELFSRFTVPFLNDLVLRMMNGQKDAAVAPVQKPAQASITSSTESEASSPLSSLQDIMPVLMSIASQANVVPKPAGLSMIKNEQYGQHGRFEQSAPSSAPSFPAKLRSPKVELKEEKNSSSSSFELTKSFFSGRDSASSGHSSMSPLYSFEEDDYEDEKNAIFTPLHQKSAKDCDSFFI